MGERAVPPVPGDGAAAGPADGGAAALMEGWRVHYDAVRKHLALGTTPAEAAGLDLPDEFRWKVILERAVTRNVTADASGQTAVKSPD